MGDESELLYEEFIKSFLASDTDDQKQDVNNIINKETTSNSSKPKTSLLFEDEDPNDPEYNILQDIGTLDFDEFLNFYDEFYGVENTFNKTNPTSLGSEAKPLEDNRLSILNNYQFTDNQLKILYYQMSFHVQILTQQWVLSVKLQDGTSDKLKKMLLELNQNSSKFISYITNLSPAVSLINDQEQKVTQDEMRCNFRFNLSLKSRILFSTRKDIFIFDWALPTRRFFSNKQSKIFTPGTDSLIAFGLNDFFTTRNPNNKNVFKYINEKYLPSYSHKSIRFHVKNLRCNRRVKSKFDEWWSNPIIYYFREKKLPTFNRYFTVENLSIIDKLGSPPDWYKKLIIKEDKPLCIDEHQPKDVYEENESSSVGHTPLLKPKTELRQFNTVIQHDANIVSVHQVPLRICNLKAYKSLVCKPDSSILAHLDEIKRNTEIWHRHRVNSRTKGIYSKGKNKKTDTNVLQKTNSKINQDEIKEIKLPEESEASNSVRQSISEKQDKDFAITKNDNSRSENFDEEMNTDMDDNYETEFYDEEIEMDEPDTMDDDDNDNECEEEENDLISTEKIEDNDNLLIDDENDLMALMEASWTAVTTNRSGNNHNNSKDPQDGSMIPARKKSDILALQRNSSRYIFNKIFDPRWSLEKSNEIEKPKNELLINYYLKRSRKVLVEDEDYLKFLELIVSLMDNIKDDQENQLARRFYNELSNFLKSIRNKYKAKGDVINKQQIMDGLQELQELLILFLDTFQAQSCGKSYEFLHWKQIFEFFRKVELYLSFVYSKRTQRHSYIQKMVRALNQLLLDQPQQGLQMSIKLKATMSKILNNHPFLMKEFSSLFLDEPISPHLYSNNEDFDEFVIPEQDQSMNDEMPAENVQVPINDQDLKYGTNDCPCSKCHDSNETNNNNNNNIIINHCELCSIRFISGRIYLPQINNNNKKLQLVEYIKKEKEQQTESSRNPVQIFDQNKTNEESNTSSALLKKQWTLDEDRLLLQACRSMILNSKITKLTEQVFKNVATNLSKEYFINEQKRTVEEVTERLVHLIEMLHNNNNYS